MQQGLHSRSQAQLGYFCLTDTSDPDSNITAPGDMLPGSQQVAQRIDRDVYLGFLAARLRRSPRGHPAPHSTH